MGQDKVRRGGNGAWVGVAAGGIEGPLRAEGHPSNRASVTHQFLGGPIAVRAEPDNRQTAQGPKVRRLVWGFSCQVVIFGLLAILCSERECRSSSRRLRSGSRSGRKGSRDRNASKAWRLAA